MLPLHVFFLLAAFAATASSAPFNSWAGKRSSSSVWSPSSEVAPSSINQYTREELSRLIHELRDALVRQRQEEDEVEEDYGPYYPTNLIAAADKRAAFNSWAGKRAPFNSWAGKRAPFNSWAGKRAPFNSWAGKRSVGDSMDHSRSKRSSGEEMDDDDDSHRVRRANSFSAWGGKRARLRRFARNDADAVSDGGDGLSLGQIKVLRPNRAAFSAWGG